MVDNSFILTILTACFSVLSIIGGVICLIGTTWRLYEYRVELRIQKHFTGSNPIRDDMMRDKRESILVWSIFTTIFWIIAVGMDIYIV